MELPQQLPGRETAGYRLLSLTAISGELPANQLARLPGGQSYKGKTVQALKERRLLRTIYRDRLRGYRLTAKAKRLLLADHPERFRPYLTGAAETNHIKSEPARRLRLHRVSEAVVTMQNAGIAVYRDEKPGVFAPEWDEAADVWIDGPAWYTSREIRELGRTTTKIKGARAVGVLLTGTDVYVTYNLGDSLMKWKYRAEMRMKAMLQTVLCMERLPGQYGMDVAKGLLLADSMEPALQILSDAGGSQYFLLDGSFDPFYFLTNDRRGERLLSLLCCPEMTGQLDGILRSDLTEARPGGSIEHDAYDPAGRPVLFGYLCDLPRIKRFDTALRLQDKRGLLICFDFQADVLRRCCGEQIQLQTIDFEKWERRFFP